MAPVSSCSVRTVVRNPAPVKPARQLVRRAHQALLGAGETAAARRHRLRAQLGVELERDPGDAHRGRARLGLQRCVVAGGHRLLRQVRGGRGLGVLDDLRGLQTDAVDVQRVPDERHRQRASAALRAQRRGVHLDLEDGGEEGAVADHADGTAVAVAERVRPQGRVALHRRGEARFGARRDRQARRPARTRAQREHRAQPLGQRAAVAAHDREQHEERGDHTGGHQHQRVDHPRDEQHRGGELHQHELLQSERPEVAGPGLQTGCGGSLGGGRRTGGGRPYTRRGRHHSTTPIRAQAPKTSGFPQLGKGS